MGTCIVIGVLVQCAFTGPRPTAQQAAEILKPGQYVYYPTNYPAPPPSTTVVMSYAPAELPRRRLDGSLWSDPQWYAIAYSNYWRHSVDVRYDRPGRRVITRGQPIAAHNGAQDRAKIAHLPASTAEASLPARKGLTPKR